MKLEHELIALNAVDPTTEPGLRTLRAALGRKTGVVVAAAADRVRTALVSGVEPELVAAFHTLSDRPVKRDPGCRGKVAVLTALDELDWHDPDVFLAGVGREQLEPAWGKPVDTAGPVRARCLAALVRLGWRGSPALLAERLVDADPNVRSTAARATAAWADPMGAALLALKLAVGDDDPVVEMDAICALADLDLDAALEVSSRWLEAGGARRETAALALGQTRAPEAIDVLVQALDAAVSRDDRRTLLVALGTLRLARSRDLLLGWLAGDDAPLVLEALRPHRFEPGLVDEVRRRVSRALQALVDEELG